MNRKAYRKRWHMQKRGFMVVHSRWLSLDGSMPSRWAGWQGRRA